MAPLIKELAKYGGEVRSFVCVTGQHREMLDQVLTLFDIEPDYDLDIMQPNQALSSMTADLFSVLEPIVKETSPHWILAQGDTTTTLVTSLVAFYNIEHGGREIVGNSNTPAVTPPWIGARDAPQLLEQGNTVIGRREDSPKATASSVTVSGSGSTVESEKIQSAQ